MSPTPERTNTYAPRSPLVRAALHTMGNGVMLADETGHIIYSNAAADRILGKPPADATSEEWADHYGVFLPDDSGPFPADQFTLVRALRGEATDDVEMLIRNPSHPDDVLICATGRPVREENGEIVGAVTVIRDVTKLRKAERELRQALASLEEAQQQKGELTGFLVHDMKSPLTSIIGNCDLALMSEDIGDEDRAAVAGAREGAGTLHRMILNLLDIQTAEDGRLEPDLERVNVPSILNEVRASVRGRARDSTILVEGPDEGTSLEVLADRELLRRIVTNLVDNCIKYGQSDGRIWLDAASGDDGAVLICVSDDGPGVPVELRDAIFHQYARIERDAKRRDPTSRGLGLRFCKLAVEAHGGRIWVEDNEPVGARFCIELPES